jgi:nicotinamidase-related amidase
MTPPPADAGPALPDAARSAIAPLDLLTDAARRAREAPLPLPVPARPYAYPLAPGRTALVVIDMQRDFIEPGGFGASLGNDVSRLAPAIAPIAALLAAWRERGWPIVHTREAHRADLSDCPPAKRERGDPAAPPGLRIGDTGPMGRLLISGEPGADIIPALAAQPGETVVDKPGKGMFWATGLHERLQAAGITHLVFTGVTTEVCVQTSMREANDRGYVCLLVADATESYFPAFKAAAIEMVVAQGAIVGWATDSAGLLGALPAAAP